jgi:dicarboxylate carrier protein MatC
MNQEATSILVLVAIFAIGTLRPINMGLLGITAAFVVGSAVGVSEDDIFAGFPGDLSIILVGVTYLFASANNNGTVDWLGKEVAGIGTPLLAALVICFIGGAVSAFASTTGILGALIPLAVPFLAQGQIGAVGVIIALSIASSVVDSSPFSTSGALVVANSPDDRRDFVYTKLLQWGMSMIIIAPVTAWAIFVLPGWL